MERPFLLIILFFRVKRRKNADFDRKKGENGSGKPRCRILPIYYNIAAHKMQVLFCNSLQKSCCFSAELHDKYRQEATAAVAAASNATAGRNECFT